MQDRSRSFQVLSVEEFLTLSARINYLLSAKYPSYEALLRQITANYTLQEESKKTLLIGIRHVLRSYQNRLRRLGPLAVLHPLRASHLLVLASEEPNVLDILTAFLHDYYEDIVTEDTDPIEREDLLQQYQKLLQRLSSEGQWFLDERIKWLTRNPTERYHEYLGRLLSQARHTPELIWVKLADRLDNTFDMRVVDESDDQYFRLIFDILFLTEHDQPINNAIPPTPGQMDEAHRLYQMFKNAIFLTLVRKYQLDTQTLTAYRLFTALAAASIQESGRILNELLNRTPVHIEELRALLMEAMTYCQQGGTHRITSARRGHRLDGLFKERFDHAERSTRESMLHAMQQDQPLMIQASIAFLAIFESFINSSNYQVNGIKASGLDIEDTII